MVQPGEMGDVSYRRHGSHISPCLIPSQIHVAIERARDLPAGETLYFGLPDHAPGRELEGRFRARDIPARTVRGLNQTADDGTMSAFEREALTDKETRIEADCIRMVWSEGPKFSCRILLLDGTLNETIARQLFPDLAIVHARREKDDDP